MGEETEKTAVFKPDNTFNGFDFFYNKYASIVPLLSFGDDITTQEDFEKWRSKSRDELKRVLGFGKMNKTDNVQAVQQLGCNEKSSYEGTDFVIKSFLIETQPDLKMPFYVLEPVCSKKNAAVIAIHGHGSDGKEGLVGKSDSPSILKFNYTYALELVKRGFTVFVPDLLAAGSRTIPVGVSGKTASCNDVNNFLISIGMSLQGLIVFDMLRLADYINCAYSFDSLGCVGFSGGGHTALWLSALDDNMEYTVVSGYFHSLKDIALRNNWCGCNYIPNLWSYVDICDIAALSADKSVFVETGNKDGLNGIRGMQGVYEMLDKANRAFALFGNKIEFSENDGAHKWYGTCYEWMDRVILGLK
jgi:hypothetical protein